MFEEDWVLCPDSGCPSETLLEEENVQDHSLAPPVQGNPSQVFPEQLVLEWDPSVDIGGSISHDDDTDSSYLSAGAGGYWALKYTIRKHHELKLQFRLLCQSYLLIFLLCCTIISLIIHLYSCFVDLLHNIIPIQDLLFIII